MEQETVNQLVTEQMKTVLGFAMSRLQNRQEAEELASDILYRMLRSAKSFRDDASFYAFLWRVAENTYADFLRRKYRSAFEPVTEDLPDETTSVEAEVSLRDEMQMLRRELSLLSEQYRCCTVLYYMEHLTCSQIAEQLKISTEMVKYYLFRARKAIREGMNMNRTYGEKSYHPENFQIDFWGTKAGDADEYRAFRSRKIRGNILLAAYYAPLTIQELSMELGVAVPYLEDEVRLLEERQYLIGKNGKYQTNIPIFTQECRDEIQRRTDPLAQEAAYRLAVLPFAAFIESFGGRFADENLCRWQMLMLCSHFAMMQVERERTASCGDLPSAGPYTLITGGRGYVWGRCADETDANEMQGIFNGVDAEDGRGTVVAMNFPQNAAAQNVLTNEVDLISCIGVGCFDALPEEWQTVCRRLGYEKDGQPNYAVYTDVEYEQMQPMLADGVEIMAQLLRSASAVSAQIWMEHAPARIRKAAEEVGAAVCPSDGLPTVAETLCETGWLTAVNGLEKPTLCLIAHSRKNGR